MFVISAIKIQFRYKEHLFWLENTKHILYHLLLVIVADNDNTSLNIFNLLLEIEMISIFVLLSVNIDIRLSVKLPFI